MYKHLLLVARGLNKHTMEDSKLKEVQPSMTGGQQPIIIQQSKTNSKGVVGFVCSLLTMILCWIPLLGILLGIISFIFSILGLSKEPKGLAIAGLIISIVAIPFVVLYQILFGSILKSLLPYFNMI